MYIGGDIMEDLYAPRLCPTNTFPYFVKPGDTLYGLAQRYGTTVAALASANPAVDMNSLRVAQRICIPRQSVYPACPSGKQYTLRMGDTLYSIARQNNVPLNDLLQANPGLDPMNLYAGQVICIPAASPIATCPTGTVAYRVQSGDTLYSISQKYNIDIYALIRANPSVSPNALTVDQQICLPT
jgi:LysM repeat protein